MKEKEFTDFSEDSNLKKTRQIMISQEPVQFTPDSAYVSYKC